MTREQAERTLIWTAVFAANLPAPGLFGWGVTGSGGRRGMLVGVALLWAAGLWAVRGPTLRPVLVVGGSVVAATQVVPMLQLMSGVFALAAWSHLGGMPVDIEDPHLSDPGGLAVTRLTGGPLMMLSLVVGGIARSAVRYFGEHLR